MHAAGMSLVEVLVAIVVGLFVLGGAVQLFARHLDTNRRLVLGVRVAQDLQLAADLVGRSLRRTGAVIPSPAAPVVAWRLSKGTVQMKMDAGNWQTLTDAETMLVTRFDVVGRPVTSTFGALCTPACAATDGSCPNVTVNTFDITIDAHAVADAGVTRRLVQTVRARNDQVNGGCS